MDMQIVWKIMKDNETRLSYMERANGAIRDNKSKGNTNGTICNKNFKQKFWI